MRSFTVLPALALSVLCVGAVAVAPAQAKSKTKHCKEVYFKPQYEHIKPITIKGGNCRTARGVVRAYKLAVTSSVSSDGSARNGVCSGAEALGVCPLPYRGGTYTCTAPTPGGASRITVCTHNAVTIRFKV